ncbi:glucosamine inositolphosphorylceramide transferase family protein [Algoriphagus halophytocola]|uniref:Glucosamine inositolphosphorylceramide transferase 1 N-terminal domain-containing protein n=1 Tax=Algoriphagus halophytocola TaxID=2991499 RepID=A0ABY6MHF8_9BACT|nr:hypothetical protein [Algoriphagus sp. TR-M5]UZD23058.1 hypothetical protein OM944_00900 [Algoriphagus sp. TR-M5]
MKYPYKVKIGLLTKPLENLDPWEIELFDQLLDLDFLEIAVLILDGRTIEVEQEPKKGLKSLWPGNFLWKWQKIIEKKIFKPVGTNSDKVKQLFLSTSIVRMLPDRKGFVDYFDRKESDKLKGLDLDVILRHEFNIIKGEILNIPKYGVWSLHHGDNFVNRGGPAGFWEIIEKHEVVGVTLQKLTPELDGGLIIEKAFYNINWSFIKNQQFIQFSSIQLVLKNIRKISYGRFDVSKSLTYSYPLYRSPGLAATLAYLTNFYKEFFLLVYHRFLSKKGDNFWKLYFGKGEFIYAPLFRAKEIPVPEGEFWADPFLLVKDGVKYLFFERFRFERQSACISVGILENARVSGIKDVIDDGSHMSYPNVFEDEGEIFMIPETCAKKRLEVYKAVDFPYKWELYSTAFEGEQIADVNFMRDTEGKAWIFFSKGFWHDLNSDLYIYQIDSLRLEKLTPHLLNPVIIDARIARNGGKIYQKNGEYFRPSQRNVKGKYGFGVNVNQILELSLEEYNETKIVSAYPSFKPNITGFHHVDSHDDFYLMDVAIRKE